MQPPFDSRQGECQKVGDAGDGPLLEIAQLQHDLKFGRQFREPLSKLLLVAPAQQRLLRAGRKRRAVAQNQRVEFAVFGRLLPRLLPADPPGPMASDGADPTAEAGRLLQLRQGLERQQKRLLRQILRGFPRTERLHGDDDHRAPIAGHQFVERPEIAHQGVQDQLLVADMGVEAPLLCHSLHSSC